MNKTVNINLGGVFFHIDEDAYQKLSRYFEAIKRSISNTSGQDEIIKDIEMRVAELLNEKQKSDKHVVSLKEVDEVIAVMGQPEDYIIEDDSQTQSQNKYSNSSITKKLYRDSEKGKISGVAAGLSHYIGIDIVWIRVLLVLSVVFGFGIGIILYIILWIVTPEAQTTSEKLEMTGEPVNISNIEKKVRAEFENVSDKIKNVDYDKYGNQIKKGANLVGNSLGDFILSIFEIIAKLLGVLLIITGLITLGFLLIGVFTLGSNSIIDFPWQGFIETGNFSDYPIWIFGLLMFFAVGIPFFFLTLLGFKLLAPKTKSIGSIAKYTLLALWIIALAICISISIKQISAFSNESKIIQNEILNINPTDTLQIKFRNNLSFSKNVFTKNSIKIIKDSNDVDVIYSNNIALKVEKTENSFASIQIVKESKGKTSFEAKNRAQLIKYNYKVVGNEILLDNYLLTDLKNKYRHQNVKIILFLPEGTLFKADKSVQYFDESDNEYFNLHFSSDNYLYKVIKTQVKCLDCPANENEDEHNNNETITINKNGISITNASKTIREENHDSFRLNKHEIYINTK